MAAISNQVKAYIVASIACFKQHAEVAREVREIFGLDVSLAQLQHYDPTTINGQKLSGELKTLFSEARQRFIEDVSSIPIAHQSYRLRRLQQIVDGTKSPAMVKDVLEQAAKEMGGLYTNKRDITSDGKSLAGLSDEELDRRIAEAEARKTQEAGARAQQ